MRIIALDPGKVNFAAAVMEDRKVLETRYLKPIKSLRWDDFNSEAEKFRNHYFSFLESVNPDCVLAERFMARPGGNGGAVGEPINIMLGMITTINASKGIPTHLVTSAQWKNALNSRYGKVSKMKEHFPHLSDHEADALGIAVYAMEGELGEKGKLLKSVKRLKRYPHVGKAPRASRSPGSGNSR
jgi:hypothetical protein